MCLKSREFSYNKKRFLLKKLLFCLFFSYFSPFDYLKRRCTAMRTDKKPKPTTVSSTKITSAGWTLTG